MHILIIGGSGQTGSLVIEDALQRGTCLKSAIMNMTVELTNLRTHRHSSSLGSELYHSKRWPNNCQRYASKSLILLTEMEKLIVPNRRHTTTTIRY
jgi:hypothetical protein